MSSNSCEIMASEFYYRAARHQFPPGGANRPIPDPDQRVHTLHAGAICAGGLWPCGLAAWRCPQLHVC
jgi:hypothetical protein